jgi:hypothetical protein
LPGGAIIWSVHLGGGSEMIESEKHICGCGRAAFEIVQSALAMKDIDNALKHEPNANEIILKSMEGARDIFRHNFGMWLEGLRTECGMSKEVVEKVYEESKQDIDKAIDTLKQELISCAGMVY